MGQGESATKVAHSGAHRNTHPDSQAVLGHVTCQRIQLFSPFFANFSLCHEPAQHLGSSQSSALSISGPNITRGLRSVSENGGVPRPGAQATR